MRPQRRCVQAVRGASVQICVHSTVKNDRPRIRAAFRTFRKAVRPAAKTRNQAIHAANKTFRTAVKAALAS